MFSLVGPFKPYVRMTQRSKWGNPEAQAYLESQFNLKTQFRAQMGGRECIKRGERLTVVIAITHAGGYHNRDLDNEIKAILDAAQGIVFEDDRWIDRIHAMRFRGDEERVLVEVRE